MVLTLRKVGEAEVERVSTRNVARTKVIVRRTYEAEANEVRERIWICAAAEFQSFVGRIWERFPESQSI